MNENVNKERFIVLPNNLVLDNHLGVVVCRCILEGIGDAENVCQRLNEQQTTISKLDEHNTGYIVENRRLKEKYDYDIEDYRQSNAELKEENEQLRKIGVMYQGHNPCETCTYCLEDKLCCGINPPILCDEMKKDYFIYGLCKKHKQIQKSFRRYDDE